MSQDLADVVVTGTEDDEDRVANATLQRASGKTSVALHVTDFRFDGAASFQELGQ